MIRLRAIDAVGNIVEEDVRVELLDLTPPSIMILEPLSGDQFDKGMEVTIEGEVDDDVGLNELTITISGPAGTEKITKGIDGNASYYSSQKSQNDPFG